MADLNLLPVFMVGVLGGVHCAGMCGGIVSAFSIASTPRRVSLVTVAGSAASPGAVALDNVFRTIAYNAGRISSYAFAGAVAGGIAQGARTFSFLSPIQIGGYWLANVMLVMLGLYLMNAWRGLARLEAAGQLVWRHMQPLVKHVLPMDSPIKAFALGGLWGWVPCGMVYSMLLTAMLTGSAVHGAAVMTAFGMGTLPTLLSLGVLGARLKSWTQRRGVRIASGLIVLAFGILGLVRAANGLSLGWLDAVCLSPSSAEVRQ